MLCVCHMYPRVLLMQLNLFTAYINNIVDIYMKLEAWPNSYNRHISCQCFTAYLFAVSNQRSSRCVTYKINE